MEKIIKAAVERGASDLHIKAGDVFRARINGKLALLRTNLRLRDAGPYTPTTLYGVQTDLAIRSFWLCAYHGGHLSPTARVPAFRMRNFKVARVS